MSMEIERVIGLALFFVMALIAFGLFGVGDTQDRHVVKQTEVAKVNVSTSPQISAGVGITPKNRFLFMGSRCS